MLMKERIFIQKAKEHTDMEEFIRKQFAQARCGNIEVQHTPIMTRIIIYTTTPGLVIGSGGERIREILEKLKKEFSMENPQIDVQKIENPDMDPHIVAQSIANSVENGINAKRLGNYYVSRIMKAGAIGCEIVLSGKLSGERSRKERFFAGYLKKCGEPAEKDVIKGFAVASPKLGSIGVTVKIMVNKPSVILKETLPEEKPEIEIEKVAPPIEEEKPEELKKEEIQVNGAVSAVAEEVGIEKEKTTKTDKEEKKEKPKKKDKEEKKEKKSEEPSALKSEDIQ
jgi:small subunit ribosomal protein S3